ncbi:vacuolar import and degradation protein-domain-containing protein [Spinellus fusiger]|nr:vacuolar import and degradation protein-domain-containing protein [Spinellus fusiger]
MPIPSAPTLDQERKATPCNRCTDIQQNCSHTKHTKRPAVSLAPPKEDEQTICHESTKKRRRIPLLTSRTEDDVWVDLSEQRIQNSRLGALYAGSQFKGLQTCGTTSYEVVVDIQRVDLNESIMSGYLNIKGLTTEFPELTTYFEGEIIGPKHSFLTRKWQTQQIIDRTHWERFASFEPYLSIFNRDDFVYDPTDKDFVYMRWKEQFLVPDHRVHSIDGASFAGFYYICYQRSRNKILGFYYFRHHTELFQELSLDYVEQRCFGSFEFR